MRNIDDVGIAVSGHKNSMQKQWTGKNMYMLQIYADKGELIEFDLDGLKNFVSKIEMLVDDIENGKYPTEN